MAEALVVGSMDTIRGMVYDIQDGLRVAVDLSGASVAIKASLNGAATVNWAGTPDPDQAANKGLFTYTLGSSDLGTPGIVKLQCYVTVGATVYRSKPVKRSVSETLA